MNLADYRLSAAVSYLEKVIQRAEEYRALYFEDCEPQMPKDPEVEDAKLFVRGMCKRDVPTCHMGPRARLVRK